MATTNSTTASTAARWSTTSIPMQRGRIMAIVPDVLGLMPSTWAMPCVPIAGKQMGAFIVPQIGAGVWIEFEQGDPDYPIWTGGFWGIGGRSAGAGARRHPGRARTSCCRRRCRTRIVISDLPGPTGGIMLKSTTGAMIIVNDTGIYIQNGKGATSS